MALSYFEIINRIMDRDLHVYGNLSLLADMCVAMKEDENPEQYLPTMIQNAQLVKHISSIESRTDIRFMDLYWKALYLLARHDYDSYLLYMERERPAKNRFYLPRREQLIKIGAIQLYQDLEDDKLDIAALSVAPGVGKAQPLYSKVLTPDGFKLMGDIRVGDSVISGTGKVTKVLGVYPQGERDIYELTFDDGSKCRCSDNHLWKCQNRNDRARGKGYRIVQLSEMLHNVKVEGDKRCNYSIDYVNPIDFPEKELPLHPYVVGVMIGNGCTCSGNMNLSTADKETLELFMSFLPERFEATYISGVDYRINERISHVGENGKYQKCYLRKAFEELGLYGKRSYEKHIPEIYKYASLEQRLWLLRGLMDTDGTVNGAVCVFNTASKVLADDVVDLVHSLGGYASVVESEAHYTTGDGKRIKCRNTFAVTVQFPHNHNPIFALKRKKKKYNPQRDTIKRFIKRIDYVGKEECQCIYIEDESHLYITDNYVITHNTTLEEFYIPWVIGRHIDDYNIFASHSGGICRMFYDAVDALTSSPEYKYAEIFPEVKRYSTNAKEMQINFGKYKPFKSLSCVSVGQNLAGRVRANRLLLCDDLCSGIEEAVSKPRLDKLWQSYSVDLLQRRIDKCKELHTATRWSVHDVIGRLKIKYAGNSRARFIAVPDIDPVTGESNFNYKYGVGFSKEYFEDVANTMDDVSYRCLYKNEPIERDGLLYPEESLRRYLTLPDREPDAVLGVCDTKQKGTDYMFLPCMYQYGTDYYMDDCICSNESDYEIQYQRIADIIIRNKMQMVDFESNSGGDRVATEVENRIRGKQNCGITMHYTTQNKETKIIVNAEWVKKHVLFKDKSLYTPKSDYGVAMGMITTYTVAGKNAHDDPEDGLAQFAIFSNNLTGAKTEILNSPF